MSIVVTGIDEEAQVQYLKNKEINSYVNLNNEVKEEEEIIENVVLEPEVEEVLDVNEEIQKEEVLANDNIIDLKTMSNNNVPEQGEFSNMKLKEEEPTHSNSALFNAIINKPMIANAEAEEESVEVKEELFAVKQERAFQPSSRVKIIEEEPELFPDHGEVEFPSEKKMREEQLKVVEDEMPSKPRSFLDKILGRSLSKNEQNDKLIQKVITPKFDEIEDVLDKANDSDDDLEIPSFLRRR